MFETDDLCKYEEDIIKDISFLAVGVSKTVFLSALYR